jgi:hypothetical protein
MKISRIILPLLMLILCVGIASALPVYDSLRVTLINQEPDPVEPGKYVDVRFRIENIGSEAAEEVVFELTPRFPFSLAPGDSAVQVLGTINSRDIDEKGTVVKYRLIVDEKAIDGVNDLYIRYKTKDSSYSEPDPFKINVRSPDAIIAVESIKVENDAIAPGEKSSLTIVLKNNADSIMKDIKVKLDLTNMPLAPLGSTNEVVIRSLNPGEKANVNFVLAAEPKADSSLYKVPVNINYKDTLGNLFSREEVFGLVIGNMPDIAVSLKSTDLVTANSKGKVTIQFVNKGVTGIKFMYVTLGQSNDYEIIGSNIAYLGKIDSDDYETAEFSIYAKSDKDLVLPVHIEYRDANNKLFTRQEQINVPIYSSSEAKRLGLSSGNSLIGPLVTLLIIVVGVAGYIIYRRRKKAKK